MLGTGDDSITRRRAVVQRARDGCYEAGSSTGETERDNERNRTTCCPR
jgi:hypothetical protein